MSESTPEPLPRTSPTFGADAAGLSERYTREVIAEDDAQSQAESLRLEAAAGPLGEIALKSLGQYEFKARMHSHNASRSQEEIEGQLKNARERIGTYSPQQSGVVEGYFTARLTEDGPVRLFDSWRQAAGSESWQSFLASGASDEQLLNIMQWHSDRLDKINNSPETKEAIKRYQYRYMSGMDELEASGKVFEGTGDKAQEKVQSVRVEVADVFDMAVRGRRGYTFTGEDIIVLDENLDPDTYYHEMNHKVFSGDERQKGWDGARLLKAIIDEAIVDNLAQTVQRRDGNRVPLNPGNKPQSYSNSKLLTEYLLSDRFSDGFSEDEFIADYTGPKRHLKSLLLHPRMAPMLQELNHQAKILTEAGATSHSQAFDKAAGIVLRTELEREERYKRGHTNARGMTYAAG